MANPLTRTIMNNMVKQSPYRKERNQQSQNIISSTSNLNEKEEQLLTGLIKKKDVGNYRNIPSYQKNVSTNINSNLGYKNATDQYLAPSKNQSQTVDKKTMTLEELAKQYVKEDDIKKDNKPEQRVVTSSTKYMDLSSYVPTVSLNSIGKKSFNK